MSHYMSWWHRSAIFEALMFVSTVLGRFQNRKTILVWLVAKSNHSCMFDCPALMKMWSLFASSIGWLFSCWWSAKLLLVMESHEVNGTVTLFHSSRHQLHWFLVLVKCTASQREKLKSNWTSCKFDGTQCLLHKRNQKWKMGVCFIDTKKCSGIDFVVLWWGLREVGFLSSMAACCCCWRLCLEVC